MSAELCGDYCTNLCELIFYPRLELEKPAVTLQCAEANESEDPNCVPTTSS